MAANVKLGELGSARWWVWVGLELAHPTYPQHEEVRQPNFGTL
jgi:hypothetical protein